MTQDRGAFRLNSLLAVLGGITLSTGAWWSTHSWWKTALITLGGVGLAFAKQVWSELQPLWVSRTAKWADSHLVSWPYHKQYAQYLYYKHRTFDVKGLSTQGKFALEMENIYVDLSVDSAFPGDIDQNPITQPPVEKAIASSIFEWISQQPHTNFAVIGPPGSGKSTLLKHLSLMGAKGDGLLRLTPVLLFLRDHAGAISVKPEIGIAELIQSTLQNLPPPSDWFERRLRKGRCLVMLDGLDEIADPAVRFKVVAWVERQVEIFGANRFLVTSRPNGYRNNPLSGFTVLRVLPFRAAQVERFVRNWYLANELASYQKNDPGVHMEAEQGANDLLMRLRLTPALHDLAVNPLLLTLIATVHRFRTELPGRRVELFAEICDVFLGKRQQARGLELTLTPAQKVRVLRVLAYEMMRRELRELAEADAAKIIADTLRLVIPGVDPSSFLQLVEDSSGLLVQRESGVYGFTHLTFQEYLASLHIKEERLAALLADCIGRSWWNETARLYSAQADASPIVERCLNTERPSVDALLLAVDCEAEALQLREDLRERLRRITEEALEDPEPQRRRLAAEHMLARRIRDMLPIADDQCIDTTPVSHAEYQLFIDESLAKNEFRQPDYWNSYRFPKGQGRNPIVGIRKGDAEAFCKWLTERTLGEWVYTLQDSASLRNTHFTDHSWQALTFFTSNGDRPIEIVLSAIDILAYVRMDVKEVLNLKTKARRARERLTWLILYVTAANQYYYHYYRQLKCGDLNARTLPWERLLHFSEIIRALALDHLENDAGQFIAFIHNSLASATAYNELDLYLNRALGRDLVVTLNRMFNLNTDTRLQALADSLAYELDCEIDSTLGLQRIHIADLARGRALDGIIARERAKRLDQTFQRRELVNAHQDSRNLAAILNRLFVAKKQAEGELAIKEGLWLARAHGVGEKRYQAAHQ